MPVTRNCAAVRRGESFYAFLPLLALVWNYLICMNMLKKLFECPIFLVQLEEDGVFFSKRMQSATLNTTLEIIVISGGLSSGFI